MHARPVIAPGLPVLARPDGVLQIGLSPRHRVQIPDSPAVRRTIAGLVRGEVPTDHTGRRVMARLEPALRDRDALVHPGLPPRETAALNLRHPRTAGERLTDRGRTAVEVVGDLGNDPRPLLAASGLGAARHPARTVSLLLCSGEPDRVSLDPLLRERRPFLLLRAVEGELVLGPFVEPGLTACLRCIDAHLGEQDPMHPVLVSRAARLVEARELPEPVDAATVGIAIGWAVRDLVRFAEGDPVSTWSATVQLGADQHSFAPTLWAQHPACGCGWGRSGELTGPVAPSSTMGA